MDLRPACREAIEHSEAIFRGIEALLPPPQWVPWENSFNWRYVEQHPLQAALQKLARVISGLHTLDLLMAAGHLQEVGSTFRMLDEIGEDIAFLCMGLITGKWTKNHVAYLKYFWSEGAVDGGCPVRRKEIRAFVTRAAGQPDPSTGDQVSRLIYQTYSDYAHARSAPIMAMVSGPPARFHLRGMKAVQATWPYAEQMPSYAYRGLLSSVMVAKATFAEPLSSDAFQIAREFEGKHGAILFKK